VGKFGEHLVLNGAVSVFLIKGHHQADKCSAWSSPVKRRTKRKYYVILQITTIASVEKAGRASIVYEHKRGKGNGFFRE